MEQALDALKNPEVAAMFKREQELEREQDERERMDRFEKRMRKAQWRENQRAHS